MLTSFDDCARRYRPSRLITIAVAVSTALGLAATSTAAAHPTDARAVAADAPRTVVVTASSASSAADAVRRAGGHVATYLPLSRAVAATLPPGVVLAGDAVVVPDRTVSFSSVTDTATPPSTTMRRTLGLSGRGAEGRGITVALVDTGVADTADLRGRLEHVSIADETGDGYGHGTFLAGLIAGSGTQSDGSYQGIAPGARILDVKVADSKGITSLSTVLRGLQAVADLPSVRRPQVLNLSLSSSSPLPYQVDPLNQALRALWHQGITIVVAAGNDGPADGTVTAPGNDPTLLTVGGLDENGSADHRDDAVADWSSRGRTSQNVAKPDVVAPGAHLVGLRSPGSVIDTSYPGSRVEGAYFLGSGTSMAAAVASGAVAALLAQAPSLTPDQVKLLLQTTAYRAPDLKKKDGAGAGGLDLATAVAGADSPRLAAAGRGNGAQAPGPRAAWIALSEAFAQGDREAAQRAWDALTPAARSWAARSWASLDPAARSWAARSWAARSWADADTDGEQWAARSWAARSWAGEAWAARSWAGDDWLARSWAGEDWAARSWANDAWGARSWAALWR